MKKFNGAPHSFCYQQWCIKTKTHIYHYESKEEERRRATVRILLWRCKQEGSDQFETLQQRHGYDKDSSQMKEAGRICLRDKTQGEAPASEFHFLFKEKLPVHIQRHWRQFCLWWTDIYILTLTTNEEASEAVKTGSSRSSVSNRYCYFIHFYYWIVTYLFIYLLGKKKTLKTNLSVGLRTYCSIIT